MLKSSQGSRHTQWPAQREEEGICGVPQNCMWVVDNPHPSSLSLSLVSSLATCLTHANKEVDVIKRNPIIQLILSGTLSRKASTFTRIWLEGQACRCWRVGVGGKTKLPAPFHSRVKPEYRKLTCSRSQDSEGKMGQDSRSLAPDPRRPPCQ